MNFSGTREKIAHAVMVAERFVGKNITLPILANILIEFNPNTICLSATNLEHAVRIRVGGKGIGSGSITIPAKIISSFLQSLKEDMVDIEEKQGNILIKTISRDTKIHGVPAQDFPLIPKVHKVKEFYVSADGLGRGLAQVLPAVSHSEFKPELGGVLFKVTHFALHIAATDTFRLAEKIIPFTKKREEDNFSFILPSKSAVEISRIFDQEGVVRVILDDNQVLFEIGDIGITSRIIEGSFPDYTAVIPKQYEISCTLMRQDFHDAVRGSSIFASKLQDVSLHFLGKEVEVLSSNNEIGEYRTKTTAETQGKKLTINFNYKYLLDGMSTLHEDEIFVGCNTEHSPVLLRNKTDGSFLYIVMPIRSI